MLLFGVVASDACRSPPSTREWHPTLIVSGILRTRPYPILIALNPGEPRATSYLLTNLRQYRDGDGSAWQDGTPITVELRLSFNGPLVLGEVTGPPTVARLDQIPDTTEVRLRGSEVMGRLVDLGCSPDCDVPPVIQFDDVHPTRMALLAGPGAQAWIQRIGGNVGRRMAARGRLRAIGNVLIVDADSVWRRESREP